MKKLVIGLVIVSLLILAGCGKITYKDYQDGNLQVKYPDWSLDGGTDDVSVTGNNCQVRINVENPNYLGADLKNVVDTFVVPPLEQLGLTANTQKLSDTEVLIELKGPSSVGKQKYIVCDKKVFKVSAGCVKDNPLIDEVINSASCAA